MFKLRQIKCLCVLFLNTKAPNYTLLALYNHWPQKSISSLESIPFLATCFSCLPKPVLLCSSSLKMFDNAVNGASKPNFSKADTLADGHFCHLPGKYWECAAYNILKVNKIMFINTFKLKWRVRDPTWTENIISCREGFSPPHMQPAAGY